MSYQVHLDFMNASAHTRASARHYARKNEEDEGRKRPRHVACPEQPEADTPSQTRRKGISEKAGSIPVATEANKYEQRPNRERLLEYASSQIHHEFVRNCLQLRDGSWLAPNRNISSMGFFCIETYQRSERSFSTQAIEAMLEETMRIIEEEGQDREQHPFLSGIGASFVITYELSAIGSLSEALEVASEEIRKVPGSPRSHDSKTDVMACSSGLWSWLPNGTEEFNLTSAELYHAQSPFGNACRVALAMTLAGVDATWESLHECMFPYLPLPNIDLLQPVISRRCSLLQNSDSCIEFAKWARDQLITEKSEVKELSSHLLFDIFCISALATLRHWPRPESTQLLTETSNELNWKFACFIAAYHDPQELRGFISRLLKYLTPAEREHTSSPMDACPAIFLRAFQKISMQRMNKYIEILTCVRGEEPTKEGSGSETDSTFTFSSWLKEMRSSGSIVDEDVMDTSED